VEYGGIDEFGWAPASREVGSDVGALVLQRGTRVVRLGPALANVLPGNEARIGQLVSDLGDADGNLEELVGAFVDDVVEVIAPSAVELIAALREKLDVKLVDGATTVALAVCKVRGGAASVYAEDSSVAGSSVMGTKVELGPHQEQVAELAETYARNLRLEPKITASIGRAARQHDEGKRDPRFQAMLYNGDRLHAEAGATLLAKSGMDPADRSGFRRAAAVSGYPRGMRHEALSARIAVARLQAVPDENVDADLVVHLAASHHGRSRPLLPPVADHEPHAVDVPGLAETFKTDEVVDWDGPARFERLNRRYGYWGLALFEAILRSADIAASEEPDRGFVDGD
jgi:CRISPR-associated endonuclease/helicase Cas3